MVLLVLVAAARGSGPCAEFAVPVPPPAEIGRCLERGEPDERLVDRAVRCLSETSDDGPAVVLAALASLGEPGAQDGLRRAVCVGTREQAAVALRHLDPGEANEALLTAHLVPLGGRDPLRGIAARTLGEHRAFDTLLVLPPNDPAVAIGLANDPDPRGPGSERLVRWTGTDRSRAEREAAARVLVGEGNPRAAEVLGRFAVDADLAMRSHASHLAAGLAPTDRAAVWSVLLEDPDPEVRRRTASSIGADEDPGISDLRARAVDPADPARAVAALAAGLPTAWCVPAGCFDRLLELAGTDGPGRDPARLALFRWYRDHGPIPPEVVGLASERLGSDVDHAARLLREPTPAPWVAPVPAALSGSSSPFLRVPTVDSDRLRRAALGALRSDDPNVGLQLLTWVGEPGDADRVRPHLDERTSRVAAHRALAALEGADPAVFATQRGLHPGGAEVRPLERAARLARAETDPNLRVTLLALSWGPLAPPEVVRWARSRPVGAALAVLADSGDAAPLLRALAVSTPEPAVLEACGDLVSLPDAVGEALLALARRTDAPQRVLAVALARPELRARAIAELSAGPWPRLDENARADLLVETEQPLAAVTVLSLARGANPERLAGVRVVRGEEAAAAVGLHTIARERGLGELHRVAVHILPSTAAKWEAIEALLADPDHQVRSAVELGRYLPPRTAPRDVVEQLAAEVEREDHGLSELLVNQDPERAIAIAASKDPPDVNLLFRVGTDAALEAAATLLARESDPDPAVARMAEYVARRMSACGGAVVERHRAEIEAALAPKYTVVTP